MILFPSAPGEKKPCFTVNGEWNGVMYYKEVKEGQTNNSSEVCRPSDSLESEHYITLGP